MNVGTADEYSYAVVQFLQLPYADIGDYTCVPHSWIQIRRATDRKSIVAYPDEPQLITKMRIINGEMPSKKWTLYMATIKLETYSYKIAYEFIMEKLRDASTNRYPSVMSTDDKVLPATATKRYSSLLERIDLLDPQSKKNKNKLKVVDKARFGDTISGPSKPSTHPSVALTRPTSSELPGYVFREKIMMEETDRREYQEQISHGVRPHYDDLLRRYPYVQRIPEIGNETEVNSTGSTSSQSIARKTLYASRNPLIFVNQIIADSQQPQENQLSSSHQDHLHHIALTHGIQTERFPSLRTFFLDIPEPLTRNPNIELNTLSVIQNPKNKPNESSQLDISKSSPVNKDHPQVSSTQNKPGPSSEVECAISKPSSYSETNASYASVVGSNSAEHQDLSIEKMVVDEPSEVSCIKPSVLPGRRAGNESSAVPNIFENANYSGQSAVRSMEEGLPMNDKVMSNDVSSKQDVDNDERSDSPEISSEEILTASPNSNEQVDQSVDSVLNKADVLADQLFDLFQRMEVDSSQTCQIVHDLHKSLVQSHKVIECIANASKNLRESTKGEITVGTSKKVTVEVQQLSEENEAERKEEENPDVNMKENMKDDNDEASKIRKNDDDDDNDDDDNRDTKDDNDKNRDDAVLKTTRGHIRTFVLPPEYDPDDTRWTLNYRKRDPELNLIELVPHSNVFIDSIKLAHCKRVSKDSKALARMLLVEIFSQSALSVCSLTGARANVFDINGTNVRPGLDESARMAILSFVEEHALTRKWGAFDSQSVINSLRSKIQEVRAKHGITA